MLCTPREVYTVHHLDFNPSEYIPESLLYAATGRRYALQELGEYVAVAVREALLADPDPEAVATYGERAPYDTEVVEAALARLGGRAHPLAPLLKARLAAARG